MTINRYNYQEFFLLYADNELTADNREAVENFVLQHPDLEEELTAIQQSIITPDLDVVFEHKELLLQFDNTQNFIHPGNFEELAVAYVDNELTDTEKASLEVFLNHNPDFRKEFELIKSLKLTDDDSIKFPNKESLYRYEKQRKPVVMMWFRMAAAAVVLISAGLLWLNNENDAPPSQKMVVNLKKPVQSQASSSKDRKVIDTNGNTNSSLRIDKDVAKTNEKTKPANKNDQLPAKQQTKASASPERNYVKAGNKKVENDNNAVAIANDNKQAPKSVASGVKPQPQPDKNVQTLASLDAAIDRDHKTIPDQQVFIVNAVNDNDQSNVIAVANTEDDENFSVSGIPIDKKSPLRGIFRKASRFIDKNTASRTSKKSGLLIGNIEIAFQ